MNVREQIDNYLADQPEPKRSDMLSITLLCALWLCGEF